MAGTCTAVLYEYCQLDRLKVLAMSTLIGKQAIVIGAGMGGLSAARVVSDYFEQVVVLERDTLPAGPIHRVGTPQAQHVHVLLTSGLNALRALFPNPSWTVKLSFCA